MPGPPSTLLSMMVARTKVIASVSSANSSPRSARTRNTIDPRINPKRAAQPAASGSVARKDQLYWATSAAVV